LINLKTAPCRFSANRNVGLHKTTLALPLLVVAVLAAANTPQAGAAERRSQAAAQFPHITMDGFKLQRKDFRFDGFSAWLKRGGDWHIEGTVRHFGLFCGDYEVGMRFGIGKPDCTDVQWVSHVSFVTSQTQCNEAEMPHAGNDIDNTLTDQFDAITCAERVIRCTGNCK